MVRPPPGQLRELGQLARPPAPDGQGRRGGAGLPDGARATLGSGRRFGVGPAAGPPAQPVPARRSRASAVPGDRRVGGVGAGGRHAALGDRSGRRPRPGQTGARRRDPAPADPVQGRDRARRPPGGRDRRSGRRGVEGRQRGGRPHPPGGARAAGPTRRGSGLRQRHPAAVGTERPCRALPGPEGRQHEHRAGHRRGEGRGDGLHREGRPGQDPGVLPGRRGPCRTPLRSQREAVRHVARRVAPPTHRCAGGAGRGRLRRLVDRRHPERSCGPRQRRGRRPGEPGSEQERHGAAGRGQTVRHGRRQARAGGVAAEQPADVRGRGCAGQHRARGTERAGRGDTGCAGHTRRCRHARRLERARGARRSRSARCTRRRRHTRGPGPARRVDRTGDGCERARAVRRPGRAALPGAGARQRRRQAGAGHVTHRAGRPGDDPAAVAVPATDAADRRPGFPDPPGGPAVLCRDASRLPARLSGGRGHASGGSPGRRTHRLSPGRSGPSAPRT